MAKLTRQEAKKLAIKAGVNFNKDYHQLRGDKVDVLLTLRKATGYRKPAGASGSTGRYFFYYLQRG